MLRWSDHPGSYSLANYANACSYSRVYDVEPGAVLLDSSPNSFDIIQGQDADCYFVTATSDEA